MTASIPPPGRASRRSLRRRRARQVAVAAVFAVAVTAGGLLWMLWRDEAKLNHALAGIRRRGEPIRWADFRWPSLPAGQNAAELYRRAVEAHRQTFGQEASAAARRGERDVRRARLLAIIRGEVIIHPSRRQAHAADLREIVELSAVPLRLCRQGRACKGVDWAVRSGDEARQWTAQNRRGLWDLMSLLCLAAGEAADRRDAREAASSLRDALALAAAVESVPMMKTYDIANQMRQAVCFTVERIAPVLPACPPGSAAREAVAGLAADLLARDGYHRAMLGQRCLTYESAERIRSGDVSVRSLSRWPQGRGWRTRVRNLRLADVLPAFRAADEADVLVTLAGEVEAARASTYPAALALRPERFVPSHGRGCTCFGFLVLPRLNRPFREKYRVLAERRMAAIALSMRLYELDHQDGRPGALSELAPTYLPAVPTDPFDPNGGAIRFVASADGPLLYSIHTDGEDDRGEYTLSQRGYVDLLNSPDLVFFLNGRRPVPPISDTAPASGATSP